MSSGEGDMQVRYERMHPHEFEDALRNKPLAFLPFGPLEWHSFHLPYGVDALKAHALCERAARRGGGIVLPPLWWGVGGINVYGSFPGTMDIPAEALRVFVRAMLDQVQAVGLRAAVLLTGHAADPHMEVLRSVADETNAGGRLVVWAGGDWELVPYEIGHADAWETMFMMALHPELVEMERLPAPRDYLVFKDQEPDVTHWRGNTFYQIYRGSWWNDPQVQPTVRYGEEMVERVVDALVKKGEELLTPGLGVVSFSLDREKGT